jgi:hypothetical protein
MVFSYYNRLTRTQQRIYQRSDEIGSIRLPAITAFSLLVQRLGGALEGENLRDIEAACQELVSAITVSLRVDSVKVEVMAVRPSRSWGELHGLYNPKQARRPAKITVWMRTAQRQKIVAFRTFLRTLLHELCHHLDYEFLKLADSFHTEGFYKRESSLLYQLGGKN